MTRGEIWWVDLGLPFGSEPGYRRPVAIVQSDAFNASNLNTTIVVPLTTNLLYETMPGNVSIGSDESKLSKDSVALIHQITTVDKQRLLERVSRLRSMTIENIEQQILSVLGINGFR